jgi:hypothetical protein
MWPTLLLAAALGFSPAQRVGFDLPGEAPAVFQLDGYLDVAPEGQTVYFKVVLGFGAVDRTYLITRYARMGDGDPFILWRNLGMFHPDFILLGPVNPLEQLLAAKPGSRVSGKFLYRRGMHVLEPDVRSLEIE